MRERESQTLAVKRAQVEFHNFASLGEPERAERVYREENARRGAILRHHAGFIGSMTPFLEIGANAGHSSYMLCNEFGEDGFALDISADSLRHGMALMDKWGLEKAPVRVAGDALNLPFQDGSLRAVIAYQMLSQFQDIEAVFVEVKRVLAPGGTFIFAEEPMRRKLSLRLYRCPYYETMKWWERKLYDWGLLGFLVQDVIGAAQEEGFGIRQNHRMELRDWHGLMVKHFADNQFRLFLPQRGWGEKLIRWVGRRIDKVGSDWVPARLLGGTLAAMCRKHGQAEVDRTAPIESRLRCPDCHAGMRVDEAGTLHCRVCEYAAPNEGGVYNLIRSVEKRELYPGDREDVIDFTLPGHETKLLTGWFQLEGSYGNKYRWIGERATARLKPLDAAPKRIRIRGHASAEFLRPGAFVKVRVNGEEAVAWEAERTGLFILEADVAAAEEYVVEIVAGPLWQAPNDERRFTVTLSMLRLIPRD
ncbi:MAG: class I SAM-dependent methyltransferase [Acidobacteriota bacterium]